MTFEYHGHCSLEQSNKYFHEAREKFEKLAHNTVIAAENALGNTDEQFDPLHNQARETMTLERKCEIQLVIQKLARQRRRQRKEIFEVEYEIMEKRNQLFDQFERRLAKRPITQPALYHSPARGLGLPVALRHTQGQRAE